MKQCEICHKGSRMGGTRILLRGHYNPTSKTRKYPNLQKVRLPDGRRVSICTQCIKGMAKGKIKITPRLPTKKTKIKIPVAV